MITGTFKTVACLLVALAALLASSCKKPEELEIQNKPQRPAGENPDTTIITPPPRIERWVPIGEFDGYCGAMFRYSIEAMDANSLYDTVSWGSIFVNWTDSTYRSCSSIRPDGTIGNLHSGAIFIYSNNGDPDLFPVIEFEDKNGIYGIPDNIERWEISYYGDYTSNPFRVFEKSSFFVERYGIPNQFVILRTDKYKGSYEYIVYLACFNYPYNPKNH
ncbi:MAG: hypothetical protein LBL18_02765 [Bacteroidales bacterium]|jgi:hypothetical protein|nr:hypothetical protein [Bacteroidales bacterium]